MSVGDPIRLGSAAGTRLIFQTGSSITTDANGIQSASIKALCPDGANVFNYLPVAGATFATVFGNSYLPADFKVDITGGGYQIDYGQGKSATVTINFKRPDPAKIDPKTGESSRVISVNSTTIYKNSQWLTAVTGDATFAANVIGFSEPVVTAKYNVTTQPHVHTGAFAQPGTPQTLNFPIVDNVVYETYWPGNVTAPGNGTFSQAFIHVRVTMTIDPVGWQQTGIAWDPVSDSSFFAVTETWQMHYKIGTVEVIT